MLKAKIAAFTGERVTLEFEDGQFLTVATSVIEGVPKLGMDICVVLAAPGAEDAGRQILAKDLLNSLLLP